MADITEKYKGHTPAPWAAKRGIVYHNHSENYVCEVAGFPIGWTIEEMQERGADRDMQALANAKLIADAPMLLSQLNEAVEIIKAKCFDCANAKGIKMMETELCKNVCEVIPFIKKLNKQGGLDG